MIKLKSILQELLDPAEPYDIGIPKVSKTVFSDHSTDIEYVFEFDNSESKEKNVKNNKNVKKDKKNKVKGKKMDITILLQMEAGGEKPVLTLSFGKAGRTSAIVDKYHIMTGAGDLNRILATVIKAADQVIEDNIPNGRQGLYAILYSPSDNRRDNIYKYYIQRYFPDFELINKEGAKFPMFVNKNYQPPQSKTSSED